MHKVLFFLLFFCVSSVCLAAEEVDVRFGKHENYERLVFEWSSSVPNYEFQTTEEGFGLELSTAVTFNTSQIAGADSAFIKEFQIQGDTNLFVFLNTYDNIRDVRLGNKLILDIYGDMELAEKMSAEEPAAAQERSVPPPQPPPSKPVSTPPLPKPMVEKTEEMVEQPRQTILAKALQNTGDIDPHAFVLSSTDGVRMTAYRRFGDLWVLINRVGLPVTPYIEGSNPAQFGEMTRYEVANNTATLWRLNVPDDLTVLGEGGSLYWRLIITPNERDNSVPPSIPEKENVDAMKLRSGQVSFPTTGVKNIVTFTDPLAGDEIKAVTVDTSEVYTSKTYDFVDFESLLSPVGFAFVSKNPELNVEAKQDKVTLNTEEGLILTREAEISESADELTPLPSEDAEQVENRIFNFREWQMGPESALNENQKLLFSSLLGKNESGQAERLITLAKLNLSHGHGVEAKGLAENARNKVPQISRSPGYLAIHGAASYLAGQYDLALPDLLDPSLKGFPEIDLWKAGAYANLGDWQQAIAILPDDFSPLLRYPEVIRTPLLLTLTEVALREGDIETGEMLLATLENDLSRLSEAHHNGVKYLEGEVARQKGRLEKALTLWTQLSQEEDPLYRTKAELALVALGRSDNTVSKEDAVNRLENLRYVWRGDDLEVQVLRQLGLSEIEAAQYLEGFRTLRDTVVLSANNQLNDNVTNLMMSTYEDLFLTDQLETISPIDAAMLYEEFRELTPAGEKGDRLVGRLAERLVDADLLARAVKLLAYQLDYRLKGEDAVNTALRMTAIQLMDRRPEDALMTLGKADTLLKRADFENKNLKQTDLNLLRARALSDADDVSGALNLLENMTPPSRDINKLEADIAWRSGRWNDAATALRQLVLTSDFEAGDELSEEEAQLLLNYAITLNLSDQRITLRNIRARHLPQMQETEQGQLFEVITRPRQDTLLADRDTIMGMINETEIFTDFLDSYRTQ